MKITTYIAMFLFFVVWAGSTSGALVNFNFPLEGAQEVPPAATPETGMGFLILDTITNQLDWTITFNDLSSPETSAHFHGPAPVGVNAGVQIPLPLGSPKMGSQILTDIQEADVLAGLWYVNIHTVNFPGGELRGQVIPEPMTLALLGVGGVLIRRSKIKI